MEESMGEGLEALRTIFAATRWWPVLEAGLALACLAATLRFIGDRLPFLPVLLRKAGTWSGRTFVVSVRWAASTLRDRLTYKRAAEPWWLKPLTIVVFDLVMGTYLALLFYLLCLQFTGFVLFADGSEPLWKCAAALFIALVAAIGARACTIQARDGWCEFKDWWRTRNGNGAKSGSRMKVLPARTGPSHS